jgi:hypothetical protein
MMVAGSAARAAIPRRRGAGRWSAFCMVVGTAPASGAANPKS